MKVLFNCHVPFGLAHGGAQIQIEQTMAALKPLGVETEPLQWWNENQRGDILHHFGHLSLPLIRMAQRKGLKVAITLLLTAQCSLTKRELLIRKIFIRTALALLPGPIRDRLTWRAYHQADRMLVSLQIERDILEHVYGVDKHRISVVPYGMGATFLKAESATRTEAHLVCTGRIGPTKNCIELAQLAHTAKVPILFVGRPFDYQSDYWQRFRALVDNQHVKHQEHVNSEEGIVQVLRSARGYVLMSRYENWCLAAHEAAACGLPVLLPDQPWSRERFGQEAWYFPKRGHRGAAEVLRSFYDQSLKLPSPRIGLNSWQEVAQMLRPVYAQLLNE